ncbi:hypothetical protein GLYMA_08G183201v4 [Glycine max]|nr:hypothetical protein GLYMA_08G183201v4 [Glycine max]
MGFSMFWLPLTRLLVCCHPLCLSVLDYCSTGYDNSVSRERL